MNYEDYLIIYSSPDKLRDLYQKALVIGFRLGEYYTGYRTSNGYTSSDGNAELLAKELLEGVPYPDPDKRKMVFELRPEKEKGLMRYGMGYRDGRFPYEFYISETNEERYQGRTLEWIISQLSQLNVGLKLAPKEQVMGRSSREPVKKTAAELSEQRWFEAAREQDYAKEREREERKNGGGDQ